MNTLLGARIRTLRESKGFTQEQIAEKMNWTRQKYARIEKGLIDISYASLNSIAQILDIKVDEITCSVNNAYQVKPMFRNTCNSMCEEKFEFISNMINVFYAHRKLYNSVRQVDLDE